MKSIFRSAVVVSASTMLSRILGLIRDVVLMSVFGASGLMDAFLVAFKIPNFLRRLFAEGAFSQAFVPVLSEYKHQKTHGDIRYLISCVCGALLVILILLTVVVTIFAPVVIHIFAPGFDAQKAQTATNLLRLTFPYLLFISMTAFLGSILQSYGKFVAPAIAPVLLNACFILAAVFIAPKLPKPIMALGWAVAVAGVLQMMLQLPQLWQDKLLAPPVVNFKHDGVRQILKLMLPAIFGVSVTQINLLLNTVFASFMISGSVSWLYTAERLSELPLGLIGVAIGTVILPQLSAAAAKQDDKNFASTLDWAARLSFLVGLPASVAMFVLADVLMHVLFVRGSFSAYDATMSANALQAMSGGVLGFMMIKIFAPAFFAKKDSKTPVKIGIIAVLCNMVLSALFVGAFYALDIYLHTALALSAMLASFVNAVLLYYYLRKKNLWRIRMPLLYQWGKCVIACAVMTVALYATLPLFWQSTSAWRYASLLGICAFGAAVYGAILLILGMRFKDLRA